MPLRADDISSSTSCSLQVSKQRCSLFSLPEGFFLTKKHAEQDLGHAVANAQRIVGKPFNYNEHPQALPPSKPTRKPKTFANKKPASDAGLEHSELISFWYEFAFSNAVSIIQLLHDPRAVADLVGIVLQGNLRIGMTRDTRHQTDLNALGL